MQRARERDRERERMGQTAYERQGVEAYPYVDTNIFGLPVQMYLFLSVPQKIDQTNTKHRDNG